MIIRSSHRRRSVKKVLLENSQENTCARGLKLYLKRDWHRCCRVNFAKFLRKPFLQDKSGRPLLDCDIDIL